MNRRTDVASLRPPFTPRVAAEWELAVGVLVTWPLALPRTLILDLAQDTTLHVVVADKQREVEARTALREWGIEDARYVRRPSGDGYYGTRDWAAYASFDEKGALVERDPRYLDYALSGYDSAAGVIMWTSVDPMLDWSSDDETPSAVAASLGRARKELPFCFTGGNVEVDGLSTAFATEILRDENEAFGVPLEELRSQAARLLGIKRLVLLPNFESSLGAQHIDCLARLVDDETFLVKRAPTGHPDHERIEEIVRAIAATPGPWGRPYEVVRICTPRYRGDELAAYTNALILNGRVYVPLFGIEADEEALTTWRRALPGHLVRGYAFDGERRWTYTDALHCRTKAIWDAGMLHVQHRSLDRVVAPAQKYEVELTAWDYSLAGVDADAMLLHWRIRDAKAWNAVQFLQSPDAVWRASIPGAPAGTTIEYRLEAGDRSGRCARLPRGVNGAAYAFAVAKPGG
jgi:agmatine deiminase